jgi:hypothetical protein
MRYQLLTARPVIKIKRSMWQLNIAAALSLLGVSDSPNNSLTTHAWRLSPALSHNPNHSFREAERARRTGLVAQRVVLHATVSWDKLFGDKLEDFLILRAGALVTRAQLDSMLQVVETSDECRISGSIL